MKHEKFDFIEVNDANINAFNEKDLKAFTWASAGAMGKPNENIFAIKNDKFIFYYYACGESKKILKTDKDGYKLFVKTFHPIPCFSGDDNWNVLYMGAGNYLYVKKEIYEDLYKEGLKIDIQIDKAGSKLYTNCLQLLNNILNN